MPSKVLESPEYVVPEPKEQGILAQLRHLPDCKGKLRVNGDPLSLVCQKCGMDFSLLKHPNIGTIPPPVQLALFLPS